MQQNNSGPTIYEASKVCVALFERYVKNTDIPLARRQIAAELHGRFNVWAAYIGALAPLKSCLDARLDGNDDVRDMFLELLAMVQRNINLDIIMNGPQSGINIEKYDESADDKPYAVGLNAVSTALDRLHSLAIAVRQSSNTRRWPACDNPTELVQSNEELFYKRIMEARFPHGNRGLLEQVSRSIYVRARAMYYQQQHNEKLSRRREEAPVPIDVPEKEDPVAAQETSSTTSQIRARDNFVPSPNIPFSETNHSGFREDAFRVAIHQPKPTASQVSRGSSVRENDAEGFNYPPKPNSTGDSIESPCPICSKPLHVNRLSDKEWREHVDEDVEPYVCVSETCGKELRFFASYKLWRDHMTTEHGLEWAWKVHTTVWRCDLGHSPATEQYEEFGDKDDFLQHLTTVHGQALTRPQILVRARRSKISRYREAFACPFCDCLPDEEGFSVSEKPFGLLAKHIARHFKAVSLFSLSYLDLDYDDESSMATADQNDDAASVGAMSSRDDAFDDIPPTFSQKSGCVVYPHAGSEGVAFGVPGELDENQVIWPPAGLLQREFEGTDDILNHFSNLSQGQLGGSEDIPDPSSNQDHQVNDTDVGPNHNWLLDAKSALSKKDKDLLDVAVPSDIEHLGEELQFARDHFLKNTCDWIWRNDVFQQWYTKPNNRVLHIITGDIIDEVQLFCEIINGIRERDPKALVPCSLSQLLPSNNENVYRDLIHTLAVQRPSLVSYIRHDRGFYKRPKPETLNQILSNGETSQAVFVLVVNDPSYSTRRNFSALFEIEKAKWVVVSRGRWVTDPPPKKTRLLEIDEHIVSEAVRYCIQDSVANSQYSQRTTAAIKQYLVNNCNGGMYVHDNIRNKAKNKLLWTVLVCRALESIYVQDIELDLQQLFPSGLSRLYRRMLDSIISSHYGDDCKDVLATLALVYQPITVEELCTLSPVGTKENRYYAKLLISECRELLTVHNNNTIHFLHDSIRAYLLEEEAHILYPSSIGTRHAEIGQQSITAMSMVLRRDLYGLDDPGCHIKAIVAPHPNPLRPIRYACCFWSNHLKDGYSDDNASDIMECVSAFLNKDLLYWLEALGLLGSMSCAKASLEGIIYMPYASKHDSDWIEDALRFTSANEAVIKDFPLQAYAAALMYWPRESPVSQTFKNETPRWAKLLPGPYFQDTSAGTVIISGCHHENMLIAPQLSPDERHFATYSTNKVIVWEVGSEERIFTLEGNAIMSPFSPDSSQVAVSSNDGTITLWGIISKKVIQTFTGHRRSTSSIVFSPDGKCLASQSDDGTVKIWKIASGQCTFTLDLDEKPVMTAFSPNGEFVAVSKNFHELSIYELATGTQLHTLPRAPHSVKSIQFSPAGRWFTVADFAGPLELRSLESGACERTIDFSERGLRVTSVCFSSDERRVAVQSSDGTVGVWLTESGRCIKILLDMGTVDLSSILEPGVNIYSVTDRWIMRNGHREAYIPKNFFTSSASASRRTIVVGSEEGTILVFRFTD